MFFLRIRSHNVERSHLSVYVHRQLGRSKRGPVSRFPTPPTEGHYKGSKAAVRIDVELPSLSVATRRPFATNQRDSKVAQQLRTFSRPAGRILGKSENFTKTSCHEGSPTKIDYRKKGTLIVSFLLENLVLIRLILHHLSGKPLATFSGDGRRKLWGARAAFHVPRTPTKGIEGHYWGTLWQGLEGFFRQPDTRTPNPHPT